MPTIAKRVIKRLIQYYYYLIGIRRFGWTSTPSLIVLMYHRILPKSDPRYYLEQPGMIVEPHTFELHLDLIKKHFNITSINEWLNTPADKRYNGVSCAITFDDGWSDNYIYGYPLLRKSDIPATIFLVTSLVGTSHQFWPEQLIQLLDYESKHRNLHLFDTQEWKWLLDMVPDLDLGNIDFSPHEFDMIINKCKSTKESYLYEQINLMASKLPNKNLNFTDILNWDQIHKMKASGLIYFGSHTQNHLRLNKIESNHELHSEIADSKNIIEKELGSEVNIFCYPNGDFTEDAEKIVKNHYQYSVTTKPGLNKSNSDPHRLKRIGMHQDVSFDKISFLSRIYRLMAR